MNNERKNEYNRTYYLKNREQILAKSKMRTSASKRNTPKVVQLFSHQEMPTVQAPPPQKLLRKRSLGSAFLILLTAAITAYLIRETAQFYATTDTTQAMAYFRALILEGSVIGFSILRPRSTPLGVFCRAMIPLIYLYGIWVTSGSVIQSSMEQQGQTSLHEQVVAELESEISKKTAFRDSLLERNRVSLGMRLDHDLELLKSRLEASRKLLVSSPKVSVVWNTLLTLVSFRILLMISNLAFLSELARRHRLKLRTA